MADAIELLIVEQAVEDLAKLEEKVEDLVLYLGEVLTDEQMEKVADFIIQYEHKSQIEH